MHVAGMLLGCLLLGQTPDAPFQQPVGQALGSPVVIEPIIVAGDHGDPSAETFPEGRLRPPEMVADAIALPDDSTLTGQPWTLFSALNSTRDRRQQAELTRMYWYLAQTVAEYHFCLDHARRLQRVETAEADSPSWRLARASAAAMVRQSELEATRAQYELARLLRVPADAPLPLPADRPHVGAYRTNFEQLFAGRTPPEPAVLIDRILPIRRQAVDDQAAAVQAAEDALAAATEQRQVSQGRAAEAIACSRDLLWQQQAFIRAVCEYNRNIAEYGMAVAEPTATPQTLVAMLIGPARPSVTPAMSSEVLPAGASEPITTPAPPAKPNEPTLATPRSGWKTSEPTLAPPRDRLQPLREGEPTLAPPRDAGARNEPTLTPPREGLQPVLGDDEPALAPPRNEDENEIASEDIEVKPLVSIESLPSSSSPEGEPRTANRLALDVFEPSPPSVEGEDGHLAAAAVSPLYSALLNAAPAVRAKQLTTTLHWDRSLPEKVGNPMSLADCLLRGAGTDRRATIEAYWLVRQRAAEYQVLAEQVELLDGLVPVVLERRHEPLGATEMLRLRSAQLAAKAAVSEAHAALVEAQYALALRIGATNETVWPLASTVPHSGSYSLKLDAQPRAFVQSWPVRRLASMIPSLGENVWQHSTAVVEADVARVAAAEAYSVGAGPIDDAIEGVTTQTEQTMAMLGALTEYNRAIAEYVTAVAPSATPVDRLVSALVIQP